MKVLVDTNAITALRLGHPEVLASMERADEVYLSVVVLGELLFGYKNGTHEGQNRAFLDRLLAKPRVEVLGIGSETATIYADLRLILKRLGRPIPTNDLWIASQAVEQGAVLITRDGHFESLAGLRTLVFHP